MFVSDEVFQFFNHIQVYMYKLIKYVFKYGLEN